MSNDNTNSLLKMLFRVILRVFCGTAERPEEERPPQQQQYKPQKVSPPPPQAHPQPHPQYPPQGHQHEQKPHKQHEHTQEEKPHDKPHKNGYLVNQQDAHYLTLKREADEAFDAMRNAFAQSKAAYEAGDGARAKELSEEGKAHKEEGEKKASEADNWMFEANNRGREPGEVDLHCLRVKEAIDRTDEAILEARRRGDSELRLIVGKGLHSENHIAKIKPAIEELMQKHQIVAELDPHNSGVLIVYLEGRGREVGPQVDPEEIARRLESDEKSCAIM